MLGKLSGSFIAFQSYLCFYSILCLRLRFTSRIVIKMKTLNDAVLSKHRSRFTSHNRLSADISHRRTCNSQVGLNKKKDETVCRGTCLFQGHSFRPELINLDKKLHLPMVICFNDRKNAVEVEVFNAYCELS